LSVSSWHGTEVIWEEVIDFVVSVNSVVSSKWFQLTGLLFWEVGVSSHVSKELHILSWDGTEVIWEKIGNGVISPILGLIFASIASEGLSVIVNNWITHVVLLLVVLVVSRVSISDLVGVFVDESVLSWSVMMMVVLLHSDSRLELNVIIILGLLSINKLSSFLSQLIDSLGLFLLSQIGLVCGLKPVSSESIVINDMVSWISFTLIDLIISGVSITKIIALLLDLLLLIKLGLNPVVSISREAMVLNVIISVIFVFNFFVILTVTVTEVVTFSLLLSFGLGLHPVVSISRESVIFNEIISVIFIFNFFVIPTVTITDFITLFLHVRFLLDSGLLSNNNISFVVGNELFQSQLIKVFSSCQSKASC